MTAVDLTGRVVIVTGASRGIGKGLAIGLGSLGAQVVCASRSIAEAPAGMLAVRCDIGESDDIVRLVDATVERFGGVDVLVNNAVTATQVPFERSTVDDWDESMRVNVRSLYLFARAVVPIMAKRGGGSIVNISSHAADHGTTPYMPPGLVFYAMVKAALERFSSALAPELRPLGIAVNALRPGAVRTEGTEEQFGPDFDWAGWATPADIVAPVAALAALKDSDFTGQVVDVAGYGKTWPEPAPI